MARDASGSWTAPVGNPVVTSTTISSTVQNTTIDDIGVEITDSLNRSGKGAMLAALGLIDGSAAAPSLRFAQDTNTGLYKPANGQLGITLDGTLEALFKSGGVVLHSGAGLYYGSSSPEGVITAAIGSIYLRWDGSFVTAVYMKGSGVGNTGWFAFGAPERTTKAADETVSASTTLQDDDDFTGLELLAATRYAIRGRFAIVNAGGGADFKCAFAHTQTPVLSVFNLQSILAGGATQTQDTMTGGNLAELTWAADGTHLIELEGIIDTHATVDGTLKLQWAQDTATGTATLKKGSWMELELVN